jgi:hypothetical protein
MEPAYVLEADSAAKVALLSMQKKPDTRIKVRVKNVSAPHDIKVVDAWWSDEESGPQFNYMDGDSKHVVSFGPEVAEMLSRDCP